jgi:pheromone shutdown-related protein TraB
VNISSLPDLVSQQPHAIVERDGVTYTLLGTAHVSKASVDAVEAAIESNQFDAVAVELDAQRHRALTDPDALSKLDLFQVIREGKTGLVAANLAMAAYQRRLAEQMGVEPGAELKTASQRAVEKNITLDLIDRDVGITLKRAWSRLGLWKRSQLIAGLGGSLIVDEKVQEHDIEKLKEGDILESSFGEFAEQTPELYESIIDERDRFMAAKLRTFSASESGREKKNVLAIVGAGHLKGLSNYLRDSQENPQNIVDSLNSVPKKNEFPWFTALLIVLLIAGFGYGIYKGGWEYGGTLLLQWALITGTGAALGAIFSKAHPLSILAAFVAAPITPLHPLLSSGMISAFVEAWARKPTVNDFLHLRDDTAHLSGWWKNRVARVFVNFTLTNLGTMLAVWVAGAVWIKGLT